MGLQIKQLRTLKGKLGITIVAAFALVAQPLYGVVDTQVAKAATITDRVVINEVYPSPNTGESEWIELYNPTSADIAVDGWVVKDAATYRKSLEGTVASKSFLVVSVNSLNNSGDTVTLLDGSAGQVDSVAFEVVAKGSSYARVYDAVGSWAVRAESTAGDTNGTQAIDIIETSPVVEELPKDPVVQNKYRLSVSGNLYRDVALNDCDSKTQCEINRTDEMFAGWTVNLYRTDEAAMWQKVATATSDANGVYKFGGQEEAGTYYVCTEPGVGWAQSKQLWTGSNYRVATENQSSNGKEGKYCAETTYADEGNKSFASKLGFADVSVPVISNIKIDPRHNGNIGGTVTVTFDATDPNGLSTTKTRVLFSDGPNDEKRKRESSVQRPVFLKKINDTTSRYEATFNTRDFVAKGHEGNYNLAINPYDNLGNQRSMKPVQNILVENVAPGASNLQFTPFVNDTTGGKELKVSLDITDKSGVDVDGETYVRFKFEGKERTYKFKHVEGAKYETVIDTRDIIPAGQSGVVAVVFSFEDVSGNNRSWKPEPYQSMTIDNANPIAKIDSSINGMVTNTDTLKVTGTADDDNFEFYKLYLMGGTPEKKFKQAVVNGTLDESLDISGVADGTYKLRLHVKDTFGASGDAYAWVTIDRTAPVVTDLSYDPATTTVSASVDADDMKSHWFEIKTPNDGLKYVFKSTSDKTFTFDLAAVLGGDVAAGDYSVRYVATDKAGNRSDSPNYTNSKVLEFTVDEEVAPLATVIGENFNTHKGLDYEGIAVGFRIKDAQNVTGLRVVMKRTDGSTVEKVASEGVLEMIQTGNDTQLSTPFVITEGFFKEANDTTDQTENGQYYWLPTENQEWTAETVPESVTVYVTYADTEGEEPYILESTFSQDTSAHVAYASVLPAPIVDVPAAPVPGDQTPDGSVQNPSNQGTTNTTTNDVTLPLTPIFVSSASNFASANRFFGQTAFFPGQLANDAAEASEEDDEEVLGATDVARNFNAGGLDKSAAIVDDATEGFSLAWYWWALIVAVAGAFLWGVIAALRRDKTREAYFQK